MEFHEKTLENGLEVIAECDDQAYSAAMGFFVKAGSRDETPENSGVSHFLEHMAFKGTPSRSAETVNRQLDEMGSHSNAYTSEEHTCYYAVVLPEFQDQIVELLADILRPSLREEDFDTEKQVILEEILKYDDQPPYGAVEKCMAAHFGAHPLSKSVLGTVGSVQGLTPQAMRNYFQQRYSPANIVLAAAGRIDFDKLVRAAENYCGQWTPFEALRDIQRAPSHLGPHQEFEVLHKEASTQQYIVRIADGPAAEDDDRYAGRVLASVLGDDSGSRYYWAFIDSGAAEFASMGSYEYQGAGTLMTFLCCTPEETASNLRKLEEIERQVERDGVSSQELTLAHNKICAHIVLQSERPSNRLFSVGANWLQRRRYRTVREAIASYQAVTVDDVASVAARYSPSRNTTVMAGPLAALP